VAGLPKPGQPDSGESGHNKKRLSKDERPGQRGNKLTLFPTG